MRIPEPKNENLTEFLSPLVPSNRSAEENSQSSSLSSNQTWEISQIIQKQGLRQIIICFSIAFYISIQSLMIIIMVKHFGGVSAGTIHGGLEGIYNSIGFPPITDVKLSLTCDTGYIPYTLGYWPGTKQFCYDRGIIATPYQSDGCPNRYLAVDRQNYTRWGAYQLCILRANAYYSNSSTCRSGYTRCYAGLCVNGTTCPVTFAEISSSPANYSDGSSSQIGHARYFNIRRQNNTLGIGTFSFNIGQNTPCLSTKERPEQVNYPAIAERGIGCVRYEEFPNSSVIDTQNALTAFKDQPWSFLATLLPNFSDTLANQLAFLSYSPRLELKSTEFCQTLELRPIIDTDASLMDAYTLTTHFSIIITCLLALALVSGVVMFSYCMCYGEGKDAGVVLLHCLFLAIGILLISVAILAKRRNNEILRIMSMIDYQALSSCFVAPGPQKVIKDLFETASIVAHVQTLWMVSGIIAWSILVINSVFIYFLMKKAGRYI